MKKRVLAILLTGVLTLALVGCAGNSNTESNSTDSNTTSQTEEKETSDTMEEAAYLEEANALPDAVTDFSSALGEVVTQMATAGSQEDLDALLVSLEELRAYEQSFYDFAAIENPPEKYAEAHTRLADACTQVGDVLNDYIDLMKGILEGTASEEDAQAIVTQLEAAANEIAEAGKALNSIE